MTNKQFNVLEGKQKTETRGRTRHTHVSVTLAGSHSGKKNIFSIHTASCRGHRDNHSSTLPAYQVTPHPRDRSLSP